MNDALLDHARKGFTVINDTVSHSGLNSYGFTVTEAAALTDIKLHPDPGYMPETSSAEASKLIGLTTLPAGVYLPIRSTAIQLASGSIIAWEI